MLCVWQQQFDSVSIRDCSVFDIISVHYLAAAALSIRLDNCLQVVKLNSRIVDSVVKLIVYIKRCRTLQVPTVKSKHLDRPLVSGGSTGSKAPSSIISGRTWAKLKPQITSQRWFLSL